ncbi:toll-like receptor Tollo [Contarinia nasturtii]|uniref:toll-like receptor Tollo n=1 Tax=Contarinia nasturtii TaxID=265458 RepID=UPI0012D47799|nr:toll-like receptor Tollo [Contarinia nasturtii]
MLILILIHVLITLTCGLNEIENQVKLAQQITDCFFIQNSTESVELECDTVNVNSSKSKCYSALFEDESMKAGRLKVNELKSGQCRSQTFDTKLAEMFPNLVTLDISYLGLKVTPQNVDEAIGVSFYFEKLKKLNASHNEIGALGDMFYFTANINDIDLSHNNISIVSASSFATNDAVRKIDLSHNSISTVESLSFEDMGNLRSIDLSHNFLKTFDLGVFMRNVKLRAIHLENNRIKQFTYDAYGGIPKFDTLVFFSAAGNRIENLNENYLQCLGPALKLLDLSWNPLDQLNSSMFDGLNSLTHLNFSHTNLSQFDFDAFKHPDKMKSIDLSHNHMHTFNLTANFSSLEALNLEDNDLRDLKNISNATCPALSSVGAAFGGLAGLILGGPLGAVAGASAGAAISGGTSGTVSVVRGIVSKGD